MSTDVLTGLFNRRYATEELERLVSRARRLKQRLRSEDTIAR